MKDTNKNFVLSFLMCILQMSKSNQIKKNMKKDTQVTANDRYFKSENHEFFVKEFIGHMDLYGRNFIESKERTMLFWRGFLEQHECIKERQTRWWLENLIGEVISYGNKGITKKLKYEALDVIRYMPVIPYWHEYLQFPYQEIKEQLESGIGDISDKEKTVANILWEFQQKWYESSVFLMELWVVESYDPEYVKKTLHHIKKILV